MNAPRNAQAPSPGRPLRGLRRAILLLSAALLCAAAITGCPGRDSGGKTILTVNGFPVTDQEFAREYDYQRSFREVVSEDKAKAFPAAVTEKQLKREILTRMLIPMAIVKARYGDRIPELMAEAEKIRKEIAPDGSNFGALAERYSKDTNAAAGGSMGVLPRVGPPYPLSRMAFTAEEGAIVGPFLSLVGCHILRVESKTQSTVPAGDRVRASHILLPFDEEEPGFLNRLMEEEVPKAKIEVLDPAYPLD